MSGSKIVKYLVGYAIEYNVEIPHARYPFRQTVSNKRTALPEILRCFNEQQQIHIIKELCELPDSSTNEDVKTLKQLVIDKTDAVSVQSSVDNKIIAKTTHWISAYPKAQKAYSDAIQKFERGEYQRNTLDDMCFALEMLIKDLLQNERSLENNKNEIAAK